ncbi:MAG: cell division protein FtsZ [Clostridiales bacterium]|nr:cell division protein FtsZ [Clostridiales bacterium]
MSDVLGANSNQASPVKVMIIGVGGGGSNAVDNMISAGVRVDTFMAINTDRQALRLSKAKTRIQIGSKITKGQGAGSDFEIGRRAAEESKEIIEELIKDHDLIFITAGMGGGTGTGAAPVIAQIAHDLEKLTLAFVTTPFKFEGTKRMRNAEVGIMNLRKHVDSLIIIPNEQLAAIAKDMTTQDAFKYADDVLRQGVQAITDLIMCPGKINVDFADIRTVLKNGGDSFMGIGRASGEKRAVEAVTRAVNNAILNVSIEGATQVIVNVEGKDARMEEVNRAVDLVRDICSPDANIIFGIGIVPALEDEIQVTVIATGFNKAAAAAANAARTGAPVQRPEPEPEPAPQRQPIQPQPQQHIQQSFLNQQQPAQQQQPTQRRGGYVSLDDDIESSWLKRLNNK